LHLTHVHATFRAVFSLRQSLLRNLLRDKLKGYPGFSLAWPLATPAPNRATIWRWLNGKPSVSPGVVFAIAGAFDIDPCALFEITPRSYASLCRALVRNIGTNRAYPLTQDLQWLASFVVPREDWPCNDVPLQYFKRPWTVHSFRHTAKHARNFFQKLSLTAPPRGCGEPQVWHFAFRDQAPSSLLWIPYGIVERTAQEIALFHYHARGYSTRVDIPCDAKTFTVETWLGPGPAEFRVASLHEFALALGDQVDLTAPCVRFP
jgi:transcriptional regulator with XRE-family HTH domain